MQFPSIVNLILALVDGYWSAPGVPIPATGNYLSAGYTLISPVARQYMPPSAHR